MDLPEVRARALEYLREVGPDFVMLAPPCGPWSQTQLINQRTLLQIRDLQRKRDMAPTLLVLVEKVV